MLRKSSIIAAALFSLFSLNAAADSLGGDPQENRTVSKSVRLYVVSAENLKHPQELKEFFERKCEGVTPVCMIQFWQNASQVPKVNPMDMTDAQLNTRSGVYTRNTNTKYNKLQLEKDGSVTQEY